jgi:ligand-binding sensor domain-containing protein/signal transduction histidine kinase
MRAPFPDLRRRLARAGSRRLRALTVVVLTLARVTATAASEPESATNRYSRSWTSEHGLRGNQVWAILQDPAGYLWLGTNEGLVRFDGDGFQVWRDVGGVPLPGGSVRSLTLAADGSIWMGFGGMGGVSRVFEGRLTNYSNDDGLPGSNVLAVLADRGGVAWAGSLVGLFRLSADTWTLVPADEGLPAARVSALFEDRRGHLWVGSEFGVYRRSAGTARFERLSELPVAEFSQDEAGHVWAVGEGGLVDLDRPGAPHRPGLAGTRLLHGRDGTFWIGTLGGGLLQVDTSSEPRILRRYQGQSVLTSDLVRAILEDREGNLWVGTQSGLNRLSEAVVSMLTAPMRERLVRAVTVADDGAVWIGTSNGLDRLSATGIRTYSVADGLPSASIRALHNDSRSGLWVATSGGVVRVTRDGFVPLAGSDRALSQALAMGTDRQGDIWVGDLSAGLIRFRDGASTVMMDANLGRKPPFTVYSDLRGRIWAGFFDGTLVMYDGDQAQVFGAAEGFVGGMVTSLHEDPPGTLWIGSSKGLSRYRDGRFDQATWTSGLPGNVIGAIVPDGLGHLWLGSSAGIVRVAIADLDRAFADPAFRMPHVLYDASDGLRGDPISFGAPTAAYAESGTLWFVTSDGLARLDVRRAAKGRMPPPVLIEQVLADNRAIDVDGRDALPPRTGHLQINYAGLSLRAPEKVRFHYLMEGFDDRWVEAGARRQAFYTNLPPGQYRFRVKAENDGVASESEAVWAFAIAPAFYQTRWFQLLLVAVGAAAATMVWRLGVRRVRSQYSLILVERSRMAREIHDTLLQSLLGVMLRLGELEQTVEESTDLARQQLVRLRQQLEFYIREARQSIRDLRSPMLQSRDLVTALRETGERLTAGRATFACDASGPARRAPARVEEHVLRIAQEAVSNALRHATPDTVTVQLTYTADSLALRVADDGAGFDPELLLAESDTHWGIMSMQERAAQIEGRFRLLSQPGRGTAVELLVPLQPA